MAKKVGIIGLQGGISEHVAMLKKVGAEIIIIRDLNDLTALDGLILPGGESTTIHLLLQTSGLWEAVKEMGKDGLPIFGTCAGAILLGKMPDEKKKEEKTTLELVEVEWERNAYGSHTDSFQEMIDISVLDTRSFPAVFIRAPQVSKILKPKEVEILATLPVRNIEEEGEPILLKQGNILFSTFHPELTNDYRLHEYFVNLL